MSHTMIAPRFLFRPVQLQRIHRTSCEIQYLMRVASWTCTTCQRSMPGGSKASHLSGKPHREKLLAYPQALPAGGPAVGPLATAPPPASTW
ncbi:hypothetical protein BOTBODRAFT_544738 [Botryobasidium botryosum FD-172 SS1]|uniref:U1-type domain-containing protein n=1 Tax=Botryobasidium botryosum (strain FD-172 SS1) TaxID=930990 RepID=A0A067N2G1_BOTB1|nr:hypothetical protein BOTBODRAFT_544738 [Botryobasidium botryosum FD-172 SS1]